MLHFEISEANIMRVYQISWLDLERRIILQASKYISHLTTASKLIG